MLKYEGDLRAREDFQICSCTVASPSLKTLRSFVKINVYQSLLFLLYLEVLEETQRQRERDVDKEKKKKKKRGRERKREREIVGGCSLKAARAAEALGEKEVNDVLKDFDELERTGPGEPGNAIVVRHVIP